MTCGRDEPDLLVQERLAGLDFVALGIAVVGRAALQDVRDEHVLAVRPIASMIFVSSWPARPMNAIPCSSSSRPGASPMNMRSAFGLPCPKTMLVRVGASLQRGHPARNRSSERQIAHGAGTSAGTEEEGAVTIELGDADIPEERELIVRARVGGPLTRDGARSTRRLHAGHVRLFPAPRGAHSECVPDSVGDLPFGRRDTRSGGAPRARIRTSFSAASNPMSGAPRR